MFTASGEERKGGHFDRFVYNFQYFSWRKKIYLDEGSILNKGQGKKFSDMGPPYLCNNSNF